MQGDRTPQAAAGEAILRLSGVEKSYPGVKALKGIDFDVFAGEVHCLVGENGAGKSTLMRVITGAIRPDAGTIAIDGENVHLDPGSAIARGIGIVHQELDLIPAMSIAENIYLGHEPLRQAGLVDWSALGGKAARLLADLGLKLNPWTQVRDLAPAQQQLVQIAKALSHDNRILILDEPTASLTGNETIHLFALIRRLRGQGIGLVYISHRLEEVFELGDRVTVFRDGSSVMTSPAAGLAKEDVIATMVGRPLGAQFPRTPHSTAEAALAVSGLSRPGEFEDVSFEVRKGEVLAIAGIVGAGRSELLETIFGIRRPIRGAIAIEGRTVEIDSPRAAIALGVGLVPEERRGSGLVLSRSVGDNLLYPVIGRLGGLLHLKHREISNLIDTYVSQLSIKTPSPRVLAGSLSGGNQQKIVIGKWLAAGVKVLLLDEPTRGVDINAKAEIYKLIDELALSGVAVVVVSSELPEVLGISDRILVLARGRQAALLETAATDQIEIMRHAIAANPGRPAENGPRSSTP